MPAYVEMELDFGFMVRKVAHLNQNMLEGKNLS